MIRSLKIGGLRGLDHFELRGLGRVNLLVGTNNSGKTTVLEGIQMLSTPGDAYSITRILARRGEDIWEPSERGRLVRQADIRRLFHGHEIKTGSRFDVRAATDDGEHSFSAEVMQVIGSGLPNQPSLFNSESGTGTGTDDDELHFPLPLALRLSWDEMAEFDFALSINRRGGLSMDAIRRLSVQAEAAAKARFITTASLSADSVIDLFEAIVLTPEEDMAVDALRIIEPSIERIATAGGERVRTAGYDMPRGGVLVRCKDVKHRIPIGSMGDGIWRMLGLALALAGSGGGVLLVDEIDTGLHFTVMADMWRLIYKTAQRLNVQVFATTHSRDCFESLAAICREQVSFESDITIQRLERNRKRAVGYTEQEIIAAAARGMEVR